MSSHVPRDYSIQFQVLWYKVQAAKLLNSWLIIFLKYLLISYKQNKFTIRHVTIYKCSKNNMSLPIMNMKRKKINSNCERPPIYHRHKTPLVYSHEGKRGTSWAKSAPLQCKVRSTKPSSHTVTLPFTGQPFLVLWHQEALPVTSNVKSHSKDFPKEGN